MTASRQIGHYRLRSLIGRGGTSEVYTAEHLVLGDVVAIKLLRAELADDAAQALALVEEGANVRAIDHPNVVRVLDAGIDPVSGGCYLVMEHVAGESLAVRLRREGPLPEAAVRRLGAALADGVAAAHACGIVHRDLKPANVMLDGERPKIVDFGIARVLGSRAAVTTGRAVGTLAYMAPEQLASGMIAPCTDIWALGVILFEAATGRLPFEAFQDGRCPQLFDAPARAASLAPVSADLDALLARCLEKDPARRPASAAALAALLRGAPDDEAERVTADAGPLPVFGAAGFARGTAPVADRVTVDAGPRQVAARAPRRRVAIVALGLAGATAVGAFAIASTRDPAASPGATAASPAAPGPADRSGASTPLRATDVDVSAAEAAREPVIEMPPDPATAASVELRSTPSGARVFVDGTPRGVTPLALELALPADVELRHRDYWPSRVRVERAGTLAVTLATRPRRPAAAKAKARPPTTPTVTVPTTEPKKPRETLD